MSVAASAFDPSYEIKYGETITVSAPNYDSDEFTYIKFVPETDGRYVLESNAGEDIDPTCELYDSEIEFLANNDDWDDICDVCGEDLVYDEEPDEDGNDGGEGETPTNIFRYLISMFMNFFNRIISFFASLFN